MARKKWKQLDHSPLANSTIIFVDVPVDAVSGIRKKPTKQTVFV